MGSGRGSGSRAGGRGLDRSGARKYRLDGGDGRVYLLQQVRATLQQYGDLRLDGCIRPLFKRQSSADEPIRFQISKASTRRIRDRDFGFNRMNLRQRMYRIRCHWSRYATATQDVSE